MIARLTGIGVALLLGVTGLFADTIPGGDVSGNWYRSHSPYYIAGNITIPVNDTLTIEPAVRVNFLGSYSLTVNGWLEAVGTGTDSIHFAGMSSISFIGAPDSSHLVYCGIASSGFGVVCDNSDPVISHSSLDDTYFGIQVVSSGSPRISDCDISNHNVGIQWSASTRGTVSGCAINHCSMGGVRKQAGVLTLTDCVIDYCDWSGVTSSADSLTLIGCTVSHDTGATAGGGVRSINGTLILIDCTICDNSAISRTTEGGGGGVYCQDGTATLTNCTIGCNVVDHYATGPCIGGGGIALYNANATLSRCTIFDNLAAPGCGGIEVYDTSSHSLIVDHCTIDGNYAWHGLLAGKCIGIRGPASAADVTNSIISNNHGALDYPVIYNEGALAAEYSDFYGNDTTLIGGNIPPGFGVLDTTNHNGDSCDVYYNIFLNPMYVDTANRDYHLLAGSPCIDAGDPASPKDPDSTITDMGRYYFNQGSGVAVGPPAPIRLSPYRACPNPFTSFATLPGHEAERFSLYDISGRKVGTYKGDRVGEGLSAGVYFLRTADGSSKPLRIVKVR
jgi:parallel beta-helix repeat protein